MKLVFLVGDNSKPYPDGMELWDTVTNEVTKVDHPPGFVDTKTGFEGQPKRFFRPTILTFGEDSILFTGGLIKFGEVTCNDANAPCQEDYDGEIWKYTCGTGWNMQGTLNPILESRQQYGIYTINEQSDMQKNILNVCGTP